MTNGVAKLLLERRADIERVFAEHDAMMVNASSVESNTDVESEVEDDQVVKFGS
jgi:hypothetical protein